MARTRKRRNTRRQRGGSEAHTVVLIEPRKSKAIPLVVKNMLENLDASWKMIIFHGTRNGEWLKKLLTEKLKDYAPRITLIDLKRDNLDIDAYNKLMMSREILDQIPTEVFLVVQTDSIICKKSAHILKEFMKYDYVGAPWAGRDGVGNGGFSLRRKSMMLKIVEKCPTLNHNEDGFFSGGCDGAHPHKPSFKEAKRFSIETEYNGESFGIHKPWAHLPDKNAELSAQCEGYDELKGLQGQEE